MRLLKPAPGELVDRQTILELKIQHAGEFAVTEQAPALEEVAAKVAVGAPVITRKVVEKQPYNARPFMEELEMVVACIRDKWFPDIAPHEQLTLDYQKYYEALAETNASLWKLEDHARALLAAPERAQEDMSYFKRCAEVLFTITDLNDKRAELVKKINGLWNIRSQEKMY